METHPHSPARIAVVTGHGRAAHAVSGAFVSLLTAVGRWVEEVRAPTAFGDYALVVVTGVGAWEQTRCVYAGPLVVVDADRLAARPLPKSIRAAGMIAAGSVLLGAEARVLLPQPLPRLQGTRLFGVDPGVGVLADERTAYLLPVLLSPSFREIAGFWTLATLLDRAVIALLGERAGPYAEPWPDGAPSARSVTCDLDDLDDVGRLDALAATSRPATLFACADNIPARAGLGRYFEVAGHGDVHQPFANDETNLRRVDAMMERFATAGWDLTGFSPPNLIYSSPIAPLASRFRHLRLGYQGNSWRFFPTRVDDLAVTRVSFYTDFLHRYVGPAECGRLLVAADAWSSGVRGMSVPCFHPGLWTEPLHAYLDQVAPPAWEASLRDLAVWWGDRHRAVERAARGDAIGEPRVRLVAQSVDERAAALRREERPAVPTRDAVAGVGRVEVGRRSYVVVPAGRDATTGVEVPLDAAWSTARWLPAWCRARVIKVANGGGVTAGLYGALSLTPTVQGASVRVPLAVPEEPVLLTAVRWREFLRPPRPPGMEREVTLRA